MSRKLINFAYMIIMRYYYDFCPNIQGVLR
jgi:hypothetical protein